MSTNNTLKTKRKSLISQIRSLKYSLSKQQEINNQLRDDLEKERQKNIDIKDKVFVLEACLSRRESLQLTSYSLSENLLTTNCKFCDTEICVESAFCHDFIYYCTE